MYVMGRSHTLEPLQLKPIECHAARPHGYLDDMEEYFIVSDNTFPHHQKLSKIYIPSDMDKIY